MCAAPVYPSCPLPAYVSDALLVVSRMLAAKPINDQLGINLTENLENYGAIHVPAQLLEQPGRAVVSALPLIGHLRPEVLLPVVVQPRLMPSTVYTAPHAEAARSRPSPITGLVLRGREGP